MSRLPPDHLNLITSCMPASYFSNMLICDSHTCDCPAGGAIPSQAGMTNATALAAVSVAGKPPPPFPLPPPFPPPFPHSPSSTPALVPNRTQSADMMIYMHYASHQSTCYPDLLHALGYSHITSSTAGQGADCVTAGSVSAGTTAVAGESPVLSAALVLHPGTRRLGGMHSPLDPPVPQYHLALQATFLPRAKLHPPTTRLLSHCCRC